MGPEQIRGFGFVRSVDMTDVTKRDVQLRLGLSPEAGTRSDVRLPSRSMSCHQTEYSSGLS